MENNLPPTKEIQQNNNKGKRNNIIVIVLSALLLVVIGIFVMQQLKHRSIVKEIEAEKDSIRVELSQMVIQYDSLSTENDTLNYNLEIAQTKVKDLLLEIEQVKRVSYDQIAGYRKQVTTLRGIMRNYIVQIDSLNQRNKVLLAENQQVKEENVQIRQEKQDLMSKKEELEKRVAQAAVLEALNIKAEALNKNSRATQRIKRVKKLRISFILSKNVTAKRGNKNIYIRITRPDQLLLMEAKDNVFKFEDLTIPYSAKREVEYEGDQLPVNIYYTPVADELQKGEYTVDIFADGNNIGTTTFSLK